MQRRDTIRLCLQHLSLAQFVLESKLWMFMDFRFGCVLDWLDDWCEIAPFCSLAHFLVDSGTE